MNPVDDGDNRLILQLVISTNYNGMIGLCLNKRSQLSLKLCGAQGYVVDGQLVARVDING